MASGNTPVKKVEQRVRSASHQAAANPWIERLGRFGYAAKGLVYAIVGLLAAQAALGRGGDTTDTSGALQAVVQQPYGQFMLAALAVGLAGYAVWRLVQASADTEGKGSDAKGLGMRAGYALSGLIYASLALTAVRLALGRGGANSGQQDMAATAFSQPFGRWLVGIAGLVVVGVGVAQLYKAYTARFRENLNLAEMSPTEETWATRAGRFGLAARGVVLGIVGVFLVQAALRYDPARAQGVGGALQVIEQQPFGRWLLGIVALGLIAYGGYMLIQARYRRMVSLPQ